jgi:hypothetical protein
MLRKFLFACVVQATLVAAAHAGGPFGSIRIGTWIGGAFTDDAGAFSHCGATSSYANGVILVVGQNAASGWLLGFASPAFTAPSSSVRPRPHNGLPRNNILLAIS